jgi:hypothetical protein
MSDSHDEKLDELLSSRRVEPAGPDLAERIILKAQTTPQTMTVTDWLRGLFSEFHLPRPAYVLACALALGFIAGLYNPLEPVTDDTEPVHLQSFLYADEDQL